MTGSSRMRLPVAWKMALVIAGAIPTNGGVLAKEATEFLSIPPLPAFSPLCIK